jgi:hypothetical protein
MPAAVTAPPRPDAPAALRRVLSLPALVMFGLVYLVPLTVFTTYGLVTVQTGRLPHARSRWWR